MSFLRRSRSRGAFAFPPLVAVLLTIFAFGVGAAPLVASDSAADSTPRRVGVLLDQPPRVPMKPLSDVFAEVAEDVVSANPSAFASIRLLVPTDAGIVARDGSPVSLDDFDVLLVAQEDEISTSTPLFAAPVVESLKAFAASGSERGIVLTGGAVALLDPLGFGPISTAPVTFGEDRAEAGLIPVNPASAAFGGVALDRGTGWITNAAFPAFENFAATAENVRPLAQTPGGPANPLCAGLVPNDSPNGATSDASNDSGSANASSRAVVFAFGWRVNPHFDRAAESFKINFKTFYANLLTQAGRPIADADFDAPAFVLPDFAPLERALDYLNGFEDEYPNGPEYARRLADLKDAAETVETAERCAALTADFAALQREALLANPEIDFDSLLFIARDPGNLGLPTNYNGNSSLAPTGYANELRKLDLRTGEIKTVYAPKHDEFVGDLELYYDASKLMFSAPDADDENRWRLWELNLDEEGNAVPVAFETPEAPAAEPNAEPVVADAASEPSAEPAETSAETPTQPAEPEPVFAVKVPTIDAPDVDDYDACYLPDDRIVFCSTACQTGVPCIDGTGHVCNLYLKELDGTVRQLTFEQDHDWCPVVLNNGRVAYLRWEYVDLPHAFSRILFHMNPDGTNQSELYGSGSYWPGAMFYARPLPGDSSKFVAVVGGHHETPRKGDLVVFDPTIGRQEAEGAVQRIPGFGKKVEPKVIDLPIEQTWPKFLHPYPISENYFVVSCQRAADAPWEVCLVDTFDNIVPLVSDASKAALEPIPLRERERPTAIPDRSRPGDAEADVFVADVYAGTGLVGVPRGTVKALRIFSYQFAYQGMGAEPHSVGLDGPWDPKRVLGTVPVEEDGSAFFKIPALTPVAFQPLDKDGREIQLMRSWITALPGESVSCVGCHERQNETSPTTPRSEAAKSKPVAITPFDPEPRGFGFEREIQPILDKYCVDCHRADSPKVAELISAGDAPESARALPDFRKTEPKPVVENGSYIAQNSPFSNAYYQLRRFVRTQTKESRMPTHRPFEFHSSTTDLVRLLESGHFGVELDPESWARLTAWIDINAPYYSNWGEIRNRAIPEHVARQSARRAELRSLYAPGAPNVDDDPTAEIVPTPVDSIGADGRRVRFSIEKTPDPDVLVDDAAQTSAQKADRASFEIEIADGVKLQMVPIPGTKFSAGRFEVTNEQYRAFFPNFDAGIEYADFIQFSPGEIGWPLSRKKQPVARVTWDDANEFCARLSAKTGRKFRLPTAAESRYLASGGAATPYWFGDATVDYSTLENLADSTLAKIDPFGWTGRVETLPAYRPVDWDRDDRVRVSAPVGSYSPNPFGLFDAQGNVAEWTSSDVVRTKSIVAADGTVESVDATPEKIVCGGSWRTPAKRATLDAERYYPPYYNVFDVGFRVVCDDEE